MNKVKILSIVSLVIAIGALIPITIMVLGRMRAFGGIDLMIFAFGIFAWIPNIVLIIPVIISLIKDVDKWLSVAFSIVLIVMTLFVIGAFYQNIDHLR